MRRTESPALEARQTYPAPPGDATGGDWHEAVRTFKRALIEQTLARTLGNRSQAARVLGLQRTYLLRLLHDLDVQAPPARHGAHNPSTRSAASTRS